jgi:hypothetical protein
MSDRSSIFAFDDMISNPCPLEKINVPFASMRSWAGIQRAITLT